MFGSSNGKDTKMKKAATANPSVHSSNSLVQGTRIEGPGARIDLLIEPWRGLPFRLYADWQRWDNAPDRLFVRGELSVAL